MEERCEQPERTSGLLRPPADEHRLEVLPRTTPRPPVHMALEPILQAKLGAAQDLGEQVAPVVDDDAHRGAGRQVLAGVREDVGHPLDVRPDRLPADAPGGTAELGLAPLVEPEQLVGVAVLLVVVDQPRIGRGGDDGVERPTEVELAGVAVLDGRVCAVRPDRGEASRFDRACRACSGGGTAAPPPPGGRFGGACDTSTARSAAAGESRDRSGWFAAPSARRAPGRRAARRWTRPRRGATGSGGARPPRAARTSRARTASHRRAWIPRARTPRPARAPRGGRGGSRRGCGGAS